MAERICVDRARGGWRDVMRRYNITVDDKLVGKLRRGGHLEVEVMSGSHHVQARIDWSGSPQVEVMVVDGADVHLTVRPAGNALQAMRHAAGKYSYLILERDSRPILVAGEENGGRA